MDIKWNWPSWVYQSRSNIHTLHPSCVNGRRATTHRLKASTKNSGSRLCCDFTAASDPPWIHLTGSVTVDKTMQLPRTAHPASSYLYPWQYFYWPFCCTFCDHAACLSMLAERRRSGQRQSRSPSVRPTSTRGCTRHITLKFQRPIIGPHSGTIRYNPSSFLETMH